MPESLRSIAEVALGAALPVLLLILGGQRTLNRVEVARYQHEQELGLARFIRERQYEAAVGLYDLYARLMAIYREADIADLEDARTRLDLLDRAIEAEAAVDAAILRIGSEFTSGNAADLEPLLGNLRQSVQLWRSSIRDGQRLPFYSSDQADYLRFKYAFASTCAYMVNRIYQSLDPPETQVEEARQLLRGATGNRYEEPREKEEFLRREGL